MNDKSIHLRYHCPRGEEVDVLTALIMRHAYMTDEYVDNSDGGLTSQGILKRAQIRNTLTQILNPTFISECSTFGLKYLLGVHKDPDTNKVNLFTHQCAVNIGYNIGDDTLLNGDIIAHISSVYGGRVSISTFFPIDIFNQAVIMKTKEFIQKGSCISSIFNHVITLVHDDEHAKMQQPYSGVLSFINLTDHASINRQVESRSVFFGSINSSEVLVMTDLLPWEAHLAKAMFDEACENDCLDMIIPHNGNGGHVDE